MPLLARPAGLFLPVIVRRYGSDIDAMFGDASPADALEDAGGAADRVLSR
jgi:hypothetical protein